LGQLLHPCCILFAFDEMKLSSHTSQTRVGKNPFFFFFLTSPVGFLGFFGFFLYIFCPEERVFRVFSV
jgi:hypothetical protein